MLSRALMVLAAAAAPVAASASDTIRHMKGHHSLPATATLQKSTKPSATCHPDPLKGRACRHHVAKNTQEATEQLAQAQTPELARR